MKNNENVIGQTFYELKIIVSTSLMSIVFAFQLLMVYFTR